MNLGVQYYRAPFPDSKYWADDFARIRDAGLNCVQLWVLWGWVEPAPGRFVFDDYDALVELAARNGLGVVLSTIAEIQPCWIHREVPASEMITHMGQKVVSSNRGECHFGITPGGCTDHPGVWERMSEFLRRVVTRYAPAPHLVGWDAWNELRWNVHADGVVCFCPHTIAAFRKWLDAKYGGLEGLNAAWRRRYGCWQDVAPGKMPDRPYTEMMAFEHFITWRANRHGAARYRLMKALDPGRPVTVHAASPSPLWPGNAENHAINRGNDWFFADDCDGVGTSSFPKWSNMDDADFGARVEYVVSAARGKRVWLSEVQGGRSAIGFNLYQRVDAPSQQRWIWNGIACGAETVLFWCWRDEVFGRESAGFGLIGNDGLAAERVAAMRQTGRLLAEHRGLIDAYKPAAPQVGVLFSPQSYYLHHAQEGTARRAQQALAGYTRALVRRSIPYVVVEEEHLEVLAGLKILFAPRTIALAEKTTAALAGFVAAGGTLVVESEAGAFGPEGIYRCPEDRFTAAMAGSATVGRRELAGETISARIDGATLSLPANQWLTPWPLAGAEVFAGHPDGAAIAEVRVGAGRLVLVGTYLGDAYLARPSMDFERFCELLVRRGGWRPQVEVLEPAATADAFVYTKHGAAGGVPMVFVFCPAGVAEARIRMSKAAFPAKAARDLISAAPVALADAGDAWEATVRPGEWRLAVLCGA